MIVVVFFWLGFYLGGCLYHLALCSVMIGKEHPQRLSYMASWVVLWPLFLYKALRNKAL